MILHLVTDRRRLAPDASLREQVECLLQQAGHAVAAGVEVVQVRERDLEGRELAALARAIVGLARGSRTRVVVNDRLDVALASGADGVHLRGDSLDAARVREVAPPGFLVGRSVRSAHEALAAGPVDYVIAGTVWGTASKPANQPLLGVAGLTGIVTAANRPVIAIGGIDVARAGELAQTGVAGIAAIGAWMGIAGGCRAVPLHDVTRSFRAALDAANMGAHIPSVDGTRQAPGR